MIDSSATHSFVPRYSFFRFLHIHSFVARTFALCRETGRQMVTEVTVNRMICVTDVYQGTLLFLGIEFPTDLISSFPFLKFGIMMLCFRWFLVRTIILSPLFSDMLF